MFKLDLEKAEEPDDPIANICWIIEKAREFQKNIYLCFIDYVKAFDCVDSSKDGNTRPPYLPPEKSVCIKKQQLELDKKNKLIPNQDRSMPRLYIVTLLI